MFTTIHHLIDVDFLREAYHRTNKSAAAGVDKVTAKEYVVNLEVNLKDLYRRYQDGSYKAPPVKRIWIEKEDKGGRPVSTACRHSCL